MIKKPNKKDSLPALIQSDDIRFDAFTVKAHDGIYITRSFYDAKAGIITAYFVDDVEKYQTVVHYLTDHFALIYEAGGMQFVGIQIEIM